MESNNPYAPPPIDSIDQAPPPLNWDRFSIWREGDLVAFRNGAEFPNICLVTGRTSDRAIDVASYWHSPWVYLTLIPGLVPYLFFSFVFSKRIHLRLAVSEPVIAQGRRIAQVAIVVLFFAIVGTFLSFVALAYSSWKLEALLALVLSITGMIFAMVWGGQSPVRLRVRKIQGGVVYLHSVHPRFLAQLTEREPGSILHELLDAPEKHKQGR